MRAQRRNGSAKKGHFLAHTGSPALQIYKRNATRRRLVWLNFRPSSPSPACRDGNQNLADRKPEAAFMDDMARGEEKASIHLFYLYKKASVWKVRLSILFSPCVMYNHRYHHHQMYMQPQAAAPVSVSSISTCVCRRVVVAGCFVDRRLYLAPTPWPSTIRQAPRFL